MAYLEQLADWVVSQTYHREMEEHYAPWRESYNLSVYRLKNWGGSMPEGIPDHNLESAVDWDQLRELIQQLESEWCPLYLDYYPMDHLWEIYSTERLRWGVHQFGVVRGAGEIDYCIDRDNENWEKFVDS